MKLVGFLIFTSSMLFATNVQEMTLDKLQNKKIVQMTDKEFENYLLKQEKLKERIEAKREENAKRIVPEFKMVETVIPKEEVSLESAENNKPSAPIQKIVSKPQTISPQKEKIVVNSSPIEEKVIEKDEEVKKVEPVKVVEKTAVEETVTEKISKLDLESAISFLLTKTNELSVYEFEQSKSILIDKISKDKRFDKEALKSMNVALLNKIEFFDFLREVKNAIKQR